MVSTRDCDFGRVRSADPVLLPQVQAQELGKIVDFAEPGSNKHEEVYLSLRDLEQELDAGEISKDDFELLKAKYEKMLCQNETEEHESGKSEVPSESLANSRSTKPKGRRLKAWGVTLVLVGLALGSFLVVEANLSGRLPGQSASGSLDLSSKQKLQRALSQAQTLEISGKFSQALNLYNQILAKYPSQPEALAYSGWIIELASRNITASQAKTGTAKSSNQISKKSSVLITQARNREAAAVDFAPTYPDARYFLGAILYQDYGELSQAIAQFNEFLKYNTSKRFLRVVAPVLESAYKQDHLPVPNQINHI